MLLQGSQKCAKITRFFAFSRQPEVHSRISALAMLPFIITENRQTKPGTFQRRPLNKFSSDTFLHCGNSTKITYFHQENSISPFSDILDSILEKCFVQGTGVFSIIAFDVLSLRSMGSSTQVCVYKKNQGLKFQYILGKAKERPGSSVLYYQARQKCFWAALEAWEQTRKASPLPNLVKMAKFDDFFNENC